MTAVTSHWAAGLIGKPWRSNACGPDAYSCWGLVRHIFALRHGVSMPNVAIGSDTNLAPLFEAARASGWRLAESPAQADDIVLMRGPTGRHCGYMVLADGRLRVLHADGHQTARGPIGCVVSQSLSDAIGGGYHDHEFWRLAR